MLQHTLDALASRPRLWNALRWLAEMGHVQHHRAIAAGLAPHLGDDRRFLDFGCGTGHFAHSFPADRYVGFDLTRDYVAFAHDNRQGAYAVMDGTAVGISDQCFDGALVLGVLHHLPDDLARGCIEELSRVLKPGATLLVIEDIPPAFWNLPGHIMHWVDRGKNIRSSPDYRRLWTPLFTVQHDYTMLSGICDYHVYVLKRTPTS